MIDFELTMKESDLRMAHLDRKMHHTLKNVATLVMLLVALSCVLNLTGAVSGALHLMWGRVALNTILAGVNGALAALWFSERRKQIEKIATEEQRIGMLQKWINERKAALHKAA